MPNVPKLSMVKNLSKRYFLYKVDWKEFLRPTKTKIIILVLIYLSLGIANAWTTGSGFGILTIIFYFFTPQILKPFLLHPLFIKLDYIVFSYIFCCIIINLYNYYKCK